MTTDSLPPTPEPIPPGMPEGTYRVALRPVWFPHKNGILPMRNPNYWQSLFIGITFPIIDLPFILWTLTIKPIIIAILAPVMFFASFFMRGVSGNLLGVNMPKGAMMVGMDLKEPEETE